MLLPTFRAFKVALVLVTPLTVITLVLELVTLGTLESVQLYLIVPVALLGYLSDGTEEILH